MKRGFGTPQLFAIILVLLAGVIYITVAFFNATIHEPVTETNTADFWDAHAHYVLAGVLRTPMEKPPESLSAVQLNPTLGDFLTHTKSISFVETESYKDFEEQVEQRMLPTKLLYALHYDGTIRSHTGLTPYNQVWRELKCPRGSTEIVLPENTVVRLEICKAEA